MRWRFGQYVLDEEQVTLEGMVGVIHLEPQAFDVLAHLLTHRDRVVPKEELLDEIWGDRFVSESALTSRIKSIRRAVDDDGRRQEVIRTVHGRGYQFVAEVATATPSTGIASLPTGTVTFLFTDIERSTALWEDHPDAMGVAVARHDAILGDEVTSAGGVIFSTAGDGIAAAFSTADAAVGAAIAAQGALGSESWPHPVVPMVRMGLHTGIAEERGGNYFGPTLNRAARIMSAARGGQIVASDTTAQLLERDDLRDLGPRRLRDVRRAVRLWQIGDGDFDDVPSPLDGAFAMPVPIGELIGRDDDVRAIDELLGTSRLVTLVGPGGVGKTRLAMEVTRCTASRFAGGAFFVGLAEVRDANQIEHRIAEVLGISATDSSLERALVERIGRAPTLLVLDNLEHLITGVPTLLRLMEMTPALTMLTTSRERLGVAGERLHHVEPLDPGADGPAVAMFLRSARELGLPPIPGSEDRARVARICEILDGLPLAIELAVAQLAVLSVEQLGHRLAAGLATLGGAHRGVPARQETMEATIGWSYELLDSDERHLLEDLSVFESPATLEDIDEVAADDLAGDVVAALGSLVDKNLVRRVDSSVPRFTLLRLIREFAATRLVASGGASVRARHATCQAAFARAMNNARWRNDSDPDAWLVACNARWSDITGALAWSFGEGDPTTGARLFGDLHTAWHREGRHVEGLRWMDLALGAAADLPPDSRGRVHMARGYLFFGEHDQVAARTEWEQAVALLADASHPLEHALAAINLAGSEIGATGDHDRGVTQASEGISLARAAGSDALVAHGLCVLGEVQRVAGYYDDAEIAYRDGLDHARRAGDTGQLSVLTANLVYVASHRGDHTEALRIGREALRLCWGTGSGRALTAWSVGELAGPELALGEAVRAARLLGAADAALTRMGGARGPADQPEYERIRAATIETLHMDRFTELYQEGGALELDDAVRYALEESDPFGERTA